MPLWSDDDYDLRVTMARLLTVLLVDCDACMSYIVFNEIFVEAAAFPAGFPAGVPAVLLSVSKGVWPLRYLPSTSVCC